MPSGLKYIYSNNTALTDPTAGKLKFNSLTLSAITSFRISDTDDDSSNVTSLIQQSVVGKFFVVQKDSDPSISVLFKITDDRIGHTTWEEFPVTAINTHGAFVDGDVVRVIAAGSATFALESFTGPRGRDAGIKYSYSTDVALTDPTAGFLKFDNATLASITGMRISNTDKDGNAIAALLALLDLSTNTTKAVVILSKDGAPSNMLAFTVSGARTDNTGWKEFPITFLASSGSFANSDTLKLQFALAGNAGAGGSGGPSGLAMLYIYDGANTASADPGSNTFRFNNATVGSATAIYISDVDHVGRIIDLYFTRQATNNWIIFRDATTGGVHFFRVSGGPTHHATGGGYTEIPVAHIENDGGLVDGILNPGDFVTVEFSGPYA